MIFLPEQPTKNLNSSIICLDMKSFSEKSQIFQFNNISILHAACIEIISNGFERAIYKGTGDGFILGLPSYDVSRAIEFCELIGDYLNHIDFIAYRIGIDYGLFFSYVDFQGRKDLMGQMVVDATRISDFGYDNHILLSEKAVKDLTKKNDAKAENIMKLGVCIAKHRTPYKVYNYHSKVIGAEYKFS